jgi:hypothetical protein
MSVRAILCSLSATRKLSWAPICPACELPTPDKSGYRTSAIPLLHLSGCAFIRHWASWVGDKPRSEPLSESRSVHANCFWRMDQRQRLWRASTDCCGIYSSCPPVAHDCTANVDLVQRTIFNPFGKTAAARRKLTMTEEVWSIMERRTAASTSPYVFPSPDNLERPIASVRKGHDGAVRRAKVKPAFRLYDLRHTYASRAVMAGVDLPTLRALLGHTSVQMTMRYVHPAEEHKREASGKIENFKAMSAIKLAERNQGVTTISTTVQ